MSVFVFHLNHKWLPGGFVGVDVFFVISGFLITSIIHQDCLQQKFSLARFYQRRIARIFPAFITVGVAALGCSFLFYSPQDLASSGANFAAAVLSVANLKFMLQGDYFQISPDAQPFLHYWSLSVEEQFYMGFPLLMLLLHRFGRRALVPVLFGLLVVSLALSVVLTRSHPVWAFYLLPTRGWELLCGSLLAIVAASRSPEQGSRTWNLLSWSGMAAVIASFFVVREGVGFPGWIALLPVVGTVLVIGPNSGSNGAVEKMLAFPAMVFVGRLSYSLYLWHWPVFSFVDYRMFLAPEWQRVGLKVILSFGCAIACYRFIESPLRRYLNATGRRQITFGALALCLVLFTAVGVSIRKSYYLNATAKTVASGGLVVGRNNSAGSIALMGDSNGSMYGTALRDLAESVNFKLTVLSMAAGDPLPSTTGEHGSLWLDGYRAVANSRPGAVVLVCNWPGKLSKDRNRLQSAADALIPYTKKIILLTMPPVLPNAASRESMRKGARPPFAEDPESRTGRRAMNDFIRSLASEKIIVIDVESIFVDTEGHINWRDEKGRLLYQDGGHLSHYGAMLVMPYVKEALIQARVADNRVPR